MKNRLTNLTTKFADACAGAMRSRRRGSFIVLVVGTLAMLSIIMIVYVAVGNADKRTSSSIARRDKSEEVIAIFSDYAAQIIADDAVTMVPDSSNTDSNGAAAPVAGGLLYLREAWDAPTTRWSTDSTLAQIPSNPNDIPNVFRPVGLGDDPWLASTTPVWLNYDPGDPGKNSVPIDGTKKHFNKRRDWLHITNIAPDGRFVNLYNLRKDYNSPPGTDAGRMNSQLSLLDKLSAPVTTTVFDGTLNVDQPAMFDSWQAGAFRPAKGPFFDLTPRDASYPPYQWADADGDGFFDSRWFELSDARGAASQNPATFRSLLPADPTLRWIFAARIIDLSSLVNVNTAGDMVKDPNESATDTLVANVYKTDVVGLSPSDVDLRRLFLMGDMSETVLSGSAPAQVTITETDALGKVLPGRQFAGGYSNLRQPLAGSAVMQDYTNYVPNMATSGLTPPTTAPLNTVLKPGIELGEGAYRAIRGGLASGKAPGRFTNFKIAPLDTQAVNFAQIRDRQLYFNTIGGLFARPVYDHSTSRFNFGTGFRIDNLVELLTFRGVNDPSVTSSLESAVGGRLTSMFNKDPKIDDPAVPYSPLRDNRSLQFERESLAIVDPSPSNSGTPTDAAMLKSLTDVRQYLTTQSGARPVAATFYRLPTGQTLSFDNSPELVNTTVSPTTEVTPNLRSELTHYIMKGAEKNIDKTNPAAPIKYIGVPRAETLFAGYASALMPGFPAGMTDDVAGSLPDAWNPAPDATAQSLRGLFYGHKGPMTALLAAGHMTANFMSNFQEPYRDIKTTPRMELFYKSSHLPYTLILTELALTGTALPETPRKPADTGLTPDSTWKQYFPAWWASWRPDWLAAATQTNQAVPTHQLNLARTQAEIGLASNIRPMSRIATALPQSTVPAVNMYGMSDAHPFLVEVASFTVYRDVPPDNRAPTDTESVAGDPEGSWANPRATDPATQSLVTVNGNVTDPKNADLMFQAVAVKIQNPHAIPISLSQLTTEGANVATSGGTPFRVNANSSFYLRIGATPDATKPENTTYFALAEVEESAAVTYDGNYSVKPVTIMPGETIIFYALNRDAQTIVQNKLGWWDRSLKGQSKDKDAATLQTWLTTQIGPKDVAQENGIRRVQMLRVDDQFGSKVSPTPDSYANFKFSRLFPDIDKAGGVLDQSVLLMRAVHADSGTLANDAISDAGDIPNNSTWNDCICDRLRLGTLIGLNRRLRIGNPPTTLPAASQKWDIPGLNVKQSPANPSIEDPPSGSVADGNYNRRFSVTLGVSVRRTGDPAGADVKPGAMPAWALDPKDADPRTWYDVKYVPANYQDPYTPIPLTASDLTLANGNNVQFWGYIPKEWRDAQAAQPLFANLVKRASETEVNTAFPAKNKLNVDFDQVRREFSNNPIQFQGIKAAGVPRIEFDQVSQIRPTDLLNVMAVGIIETPVDKNGAEITDPYKRWTTTAEMLAIATNYAVAPSAPESWETEKIPTTQQFRYGPLDYYYFYTPPTGSPAKALFDGGYLRTDDFVPVRFDNADKPYTAGTGAPIAGNVLSTFRMNKDAFGSLTSATPGLININTAPQAVLRTLPFTFPAKDFASTNTNAFWVGLSETEAKQTDVAAMIESYRDKIAVELRKDAQDKKPQQSWFAGFFDRDQASIKLADEQGEPNDPKIGDYTGTAGNYVGGRFWSNGIPGIREGAGFRSVGELLAVRHVALDSNGVPTTTAGFDLPNNIDFLGYRALNAKTNLLGTDNNFATKGTIDPDTGVFTLTDMEPLQFGHTYQDKLKILSGLLGSVTVRSDMYAVWFIARGYQRSDCEGLPELQPMVPTVERRFLMIIDRSNVTRIGQKPRVLAFVEVPL